MATATKRKRKSSTKFQPSVSVIFSTFDSSGRPVYRNIRDCDIKKWKNLTSNDYSPHGGTPLIDATAKFIEHLDEIKKPGQVTIGILADESGSMNNNRQSVIDGINEFVGGMSSVDDVDNDNDGKVLAVIFTDGHENSSRETTTKELSALISEKESEDWTFIYLGANQDSWAVSREMGYGQNTATFDFASTPVGTGSTMRSAGNISSLYLASNAGYQNLATEMSGGTMNEDGTLTNSSNETLSVDEAIKKAKGEQS